MKIQTIFPFFSWLSRYNAKFFPKDLIAGFTVAVVLIPQSMSYAMIAGLPAVYGLYAASLPPIIAALWGRSSLLATGPVAIVSLLTFSSVLPYAKPGSPDFIYMAIHLAALVGLIQFFMGVFKMGFIMRFVSHPVIVGFTNAGAIIIASTQMKHLLGIKIKDSEFILPVFIDLFKNIIHTNPYTLFVGIFSLGIILFGRRIHRDFPGAMVAAVIFTALGYFLKLDQYGVSLIGQMPSGLPSFSPPFGGHIGLELSNDTSDMVTSIKAYLDLETSLRLVGPALIIAIVGFMEAMAITKSLSEKTKEPIDINQELVGQGMANLIGSFFMSYPVSGSFSRSAVNFQAGARTALSNIISGFIVMLALLFFTFTFTYLPKATLAAIVISAVVGLIRESQFVKLFRTNRSDGWVAVITFSFSFLTKPDYAIFIGIFCSLLIFLWDSMKPRIIILARDPRAEIFVNAEGKKLPLCPQILYIMPEFSIYFANAEYFKGHILNIVEEHKKRFSDENHIMKFLLIDMEMVNKIDATGIDEMKELIIELRKKGIEVYLVNVKSPVDEALKGAQMHLYFKQDKWFASKADAITRLFNQIDYDYCKKVCPNVAFWECETVKN